MILSFFPLLAARVLACVWLGGGFWKSCIGYDFLNISGVWVVALPHVSHTYDIFFLYPTPLSLTEYIVGSAAKQAIGLLHPCPSPPPPPPSPTTGHLA